MDLLLSEGVRLHLYLMGPGCTYNEDPTLVELIPGICHSQEQN